MEMGVDGGELDVEMSGEPVSRLFVTFSGNDSLLTRQEPT